MKPAYSLKDQTISVYTHCLVLLLENIFSFFYNHTLCLLGWARINLKFQTLKIEVLPETEFTSRSGNSKHTYIYLCLCSWMCKSMDLRPFSSVARDSLYRTTAPLVSNSVQMDILLSCCLSCLYVQVRAPGWEGKLKDRDYLRCVHPLSAAQHSQGWSQNPIKISLLKPQSPRLDFHLSKHSDLSGTWFCFSGSWFQLDPPWLCLCCRLPFLLSCCRCFSIPHPLLDGHAPDSLTKCVLLGCLAWVWWVWVSS